MFRIAKIVIFNKNNPTQKFVIFAASNEKPMIKKVYKFGGASVKDAEAVRNLAHIVAQHKDEDIFLVVSAMGKTTNMLEKALEEWKVESGKWKVATAG